MRVALFLTTINNNHCFNVLVYADDIVLLAPSWRGLQHLLDILLVQSSLINLSCNINKTVCMCFMPKKRNCMYGTVFPCFRFGACDLQFVSHFKYFRHIITHNLPDDKRYTKRNPIYVCPL